MPAGVGEGPKRDQLASNEATPSTTTWFCAPNWLPGQRNICIRGEPPEAGVLKFALFVPSPSAASART